MDITEGSGAKLACLVGYMDITEGSRAMLGSPVRYRVITKGYRAKLGWPVWFMDVTEVSKAMLGNTKQPNLALEPSMMAMYPTGGHPNLAKDLSVMPHYMSVLLIIRPKKLLLTSLSPCSRCCP
jgi:hypothetical protein